MKFFLIPVTLILLSCSAGKKTIPPPEQASVQAKDTLPKEAEISFPVVTYDAGNVEPGTTVRHTFIFKNSGTAPLTVTDVKTACSCTVPKWTTTPVMPGDSGTINVVFDTKGYSGHFDKWMTVYATGRRPTAVLYLVGNIQAPSEGGEKH